MNVKNSYGRGVFFEDFGRCKIRCYLGAGLGGSWGRFSELFGRFWVDFGALKRSPILKPKLEAEKVVSRTRRRGHRESTGGSGGPNNDR